MSINDFGATLLTLPQIIKNNFFIIPDYQRGYSWEKREVKDLLTDIENLIKGQSSTRHFTGTLVLSRGKANNKYDIVDGQQRLTTLFILIARIRICLDGKFNEEIYKTYLFRGQIGKEEAILQLNSDTHSFYRNIIIENEPLGGHSIEIEAQNRLLTAMQIIDKWLDQYKKNTLDISAVKKVLENDIGFLVYAPKDTTEVGIMFEVINNRGKPLSELEKVKNYLIYSSVKLHATTLRKDIDNIWSQILKNLNIAKKTSAQDEGAFLRYCLVVYYSLSKADSQYGYQQIKQKFNIENILNNKEKSAEAIKDIGKLISFLKVASLWYARLYGRNHNGLDKKTIKYLNQIKSQDAHASIMPTFLAIVIKNKNIPHRLLNVLEVINFRVYMSNGIKGRKDGGQARLYKDASGYYHNHLQKRLKNDNYDIKIKSEDQALELCLTKFGVSNASDDAFKNSFLLDTTKNDDFYKWQGLKYFLISYEQFLQPNKTIDINKIVKSRAEGKSSDYLSIEHLWATANRSNSNENNRTKDKEQKRRLGNFVLLELRLNIQGKDHDLDYKIKLYKGKAKEEAPTDLQQVRRVCETAQQFYSDYANRQRYKGYYYDIYKNIIDQNEQNYIDFALERWSLDNFYGYEEACEWNNINGT